MYFSKKKLHQLAYLYVHFKYTSQQFQWCSLMLPRYSIQIVQISSNIQNRSVLEYKYEVFVWSNDHIIQYNIFYLWWSSTSAHILLSKSCVHNRSDLRRFTTPHLFHAFDRRAVDESQLTEHTPLPLLKTTVTSPRDTTSRWSLIWPREESESSAPRSFGNISPINQPATTPRTKGTKNGKTQPLHPAIVVVCVPS